MPIRNDASWRPLIRRIHLCIGFALSLPLIVLGLSGSLLVFDEELRSAFAAPTQAAAGAPQSIERILAAAQAAAPHGFVPSFYSAPDHEGALASVRLAPASRERAGPEGSLRLDIDPVSLAVYRDEPTDNFFRVVHAVHANLLLSGRQLVGCLGIAMLALGASGLVNWWPRRRRWQEAFAIRRKSRSLALARQVHDAFGTWMLLVFMMVSFTGVYLAFPQPVATAIAFFFPARDLRSAGTAVTVTPQPGVTPLSVDDAVALAQKEAPDTRVGFVALPARPDQPIRVSLLRAGAERGAPAVTAYVDPWTRRGATILDPGTYTGGETILAWQHPLHSGRGLGLLWRCLVFVTGFLPLLFVTTGVLMWQRKRRTRLAWQPHAAPPEFDPASRAAE